MSLSYVVEKPNTRYVTEAECPMKFSNDDISIDEAVDSIVARRKSGVPFTFPNSKLLASAVMGEQWWSVDNA